jgi:outer membrane protein OmpA-like peptidoglycan-associated protein
MTDSFETDNGLDPSDPTDGVADNDGDGLSNIEEMNSGTDVSNSDTDGDGQDDGAEIASNSNPKDETDTYLDSDGDGLSDEYETANNLDSTDPSDGSTDSDGDGLSNVAEMIAGTDISNSDTDGDGQDDGAEIASNSDPKDEANTSIDSDGDGLSDEVVTTNSLDSSAPSDGSIDSGKDGQDNVTEITSNSDPKDKKSNIEVDEDSGNNAKSTGNSLSFTSGDDIYYFRTGSSTISKTDSKLINLANELKSSNQKITLVGHTDNTGSTSTNLHLAKLRANKISAFLISQGVSSSQITINSEGEDNPLYPNNNAENRSKNRRVEIVYSL